MPGIFLPEQVLARMRRVDGAGGAGESKSQNEGIAIARETLESIKGLVQGVQVSAPFGHLEQALGVLS